MEGLTGEPKNKQEQVMGNPTGKGGFEKGISGNPGGRPKIMDGVQELAREHTPAAINTLVSIMNDEKAHHSARVAASNAILDRGYGKAPASVKIENKEPSAAEVFINILKALDDPKPGAGDDADKPSEEKADDGVHQSAKLDADKEDTLH